ncbi:MAG: hypothetical protein KDB54_04925 [Solirubrobacterales bacterium]|nr:hypothetical protein [Solirubrobacterales bacterium]
MPEIEARRRYQFDQREEIGTLGTFRPAQAAILGLAAAVVLGTLYLTQSVTGLVLAGAQLIAVGAVITVPVRGRKLDEWAPVWVNWRLRRRRVEAGYRSRVPTAGIRVVGSEAKDPAACLPIQLRDLDMLQVEYGRGQVGVIRDSSQGTYTALIKVRVGSFGFRDHGEQERQLEAYGLALAAAAQDGSAIRRIQWIERTLPQGGDELAAYLQRERDEHVPLESDAVRSYIELIEQAAPTAQEHEILLAVQVDAKSAGREAKRHGKGEDGFVAVLLSEVENFAEGISRAGVVPVGILTPRQYARSIRDGFDPWGREARQRLGVIDAGRADVAPGRMGPLADQGAWNHYRSDGAVHIAYWIASWPRVQVHASFLMPLLMQSQAVRAVSVVMAPIPFSVAMRRAEHRQTAEDADEIQRSKQGFSSTARVRNRKRAATRKDEELAVGHGEMRFSGYLVASGPTVDRAEEAALTMERSAMRIGLELQRLDGEHDIAVAFGLPLCRGLVK